MPLLFSDDRISKQFSGRVSPLFGKLKPVQVLQSKLSFVYKITKMQLSVEKLNPKYLGIGGAGLFLFGSLFGFLGFPAILHSQVASQLALKKGSEMRDIWAKIPDPLDFKVYIFNVTNPNDVQKGAKPVVIEVGPFFYEEYKEKINLTDHNEDDTVSFNPKDTFIFNREKSEGLMDDAIVTIPHPALLAIILSTERERPMALKLITKAFDVLFGKTNSIFLTTTVRQMLFNGIPLFCNSTEFAVKAVCQELRRRDQFQKFSDQFLGFSFFGLRNATLGGRFRVKRGIQNIKELGQIVEYKGQKKLSIWSGEECNKFMGSDSTIFPPFLAPGEKVAAFTPEICRSVEAYHVGNTTYKGFNAFTYTADFGDMSSDPHLKCFCTTPDTCMKKGVHDMTNCVGVPFIASLPHFYLAHPDYQNGVYGMNPIKDKHEIFSIFEPMTATPMYAHRRLQLSIDVHPVEGIEFMKDLPRVIFPVLWVHEGIELSKELLDKVRVIYTVTSVMNVLKWISMVSGLGLGGLGVFLFKKMKEGMSSVDVAPGRKPTGITPLEVRARY